MQDGPQQTRATATFVDGRDWLEAALCLVFIALFPPLLVHLWTAPRETVPGWIAIAFTAAFLGAAPALIRSVLDARTRRVTVDARAGTVSVAAKGILNTGLTERALAAVTRIEIRTTDNDGEWHRAVVLFDEGDPLCIAQGSWKPEVRETAERFLAVALPARPDLAIHERPTTR